MDVQERAEVTTIGGKACAGAKKLLIFRDARSRSKVGAMLRRFSSMFGFVAKFENPVSYCACQQKQRFGSLRCESTRLHDATWKNDENGPEN